MFGHCIFLLIGVSGNALLIASLIFTGWRVGKYWSSNAIVLVGVISIWIAASVVRYVLERWGCD